MSFDLAEYLRQQKLNPTINSDSSQTISQMQALPVQNSIQQPVQQQPNPIQSTDVRNTTPDSTQPINVSQPNPSMNPNTSVNVGDPLPESIFKPGPMTQKYQSDIANEPMKSDYHVGKGRRFASILAGIAGGFAGGGLPGGLDLARKVADDPYNKAHDAFAQKLGNEASQSVQEQSNNAAMQKYYTELPKIGLEQAQTAEANRKASAYTPTSAADAYALNQSKLQRSDKDSYVATLQDGTTVPGLTWNSQSHGYEVMGRPYTIPQGAKIAKLGAGGERPDHSSFAQLKDAEAAIANPLTSPTDLKAAHDFVDEHNNGKNIPMQTFNPAQGINVWTDRRNVVGKQGPNQPTLYDNKGNATTGGVSGISRTPPPQAPEGAVDKLAGDYKVLDQFDNINKMLKDKSFTGGMGPLAGKITLAKFKLLGGAGMSDKQRQLGIAIANAAKDDSYQQAGKNITGREGTLLRDTVIHDDDSLATALVKLQTRDRILRKDYEFRKTALGRAGGNVPNAPQNSSSDTVSYKGRDIPRTTSKDGVNYTFNEAKQQYEEVRK